MFVSGNQKISTSVIQSKVDYWHHQCQKYQFMIDIDKYGIEYAIRLREPPYIIRNDEKIYYSHLDKFKSKNLYYIKNYKLILAEMHAMKDKSVLKQKLNESIEILKLWKREFYAFR